MFNHVYSWVLVAMAQEVIQGHRSIRDCGRAGCAQQGLREAETLGTGPGLWVTAEGRWGQDREFGLQFCAYLAAISVL